ncbi:hypothetical protein DLJ49_12710 [Rhodovulum sp. 12E13]|uniref:hypothetical protein n=1 Tax=Rhodovulum sp. 12E13 TaxID=2203891 RepID=UPI000E1479B4|nr:hypothetical protein [Rhodovulum sp. 12E13]RDC71949.1 hypothetical protein DLJ49_12710 [Rhodovulum sp. 12E13]
MRNKGLLIFECFLLGVAIFFIVEALGYNERARLVPLLVGVPTALLIAFQIAIDHVPGFERFAPAQVKPGFVDRDKIGRKSAAALPADEVRRRELTALGWVLGLGVALTLFGFYIVLPLFLIGFLRVLAGLDWTRTLVSTAVAIGILYSAFVWFLRVDLYPGLFPLVG